MDKLTPVQRSRNMSNIRSKNTKAELIVFDELTKLGYKFEKHFPLIGKPDVAFVDKKIVLFVDGEFWHGKYFKKIKKRLPKFWIDKIKKNIQRDKENRSELKKLGWKILRVWDDDLLKNENKELNIINSKLNTVWIKKNKNINIFSFFSGIGFLDLGFERAGYNISFVNEYSPSFMEAYKYARDKMGIQTPRFGFNIGDVSNLTKEPLQISLETMVIKAKKTGLVGFIAGPPCPDFSVGGKNKGRHGERGKLSDTYVSLVNQQKPDFFLFENVKGLWKTRKHREFYEELKNRLHDGGYITTDRLVNALEYGVPQNRSRIILLGFRKELLKKLGYKFSKKQFDLPESVFPWKKYSKYNLDDILALNWPKKNTYGSRNLCCPKGIIKELAVQYWFDKNNVNNHINAKHHFKPKAGLKRFMKILEGDVTKKSFKRLHRWRFSPTAAYGNNEVHLHPYLPRRLSVSEALAIQSLPKEFVLPENMTLTDMFKSVGNGIPFLTAISIAKSIIDFL
jgi:DNA (cytosine-5)-methyltransferase 1